MLKKFILIFFSIALYAPKNVFSEPIFGLGQAIDITTKLHAFDGRPSWLIVIRDVDHNQNIPYLYDFEKGDNQWIAFTYGRNYLILASTLSFSPYSNDPWRTKKIHNFCHLESRGRIIRNKAISITLKGELSPNTCRFKCYVTYYPGSNFQITPFGDP